MPTYHREEASRVLMADQIDIVLRDDSGASTTISYRSVAGKVTAQVDSVERTVTGGKNDMQWYDIAILLPNVVLAGAETTPSTSSSIVVPGADLDEG